jgi:hypothetical protein
VNGAEEFETMDQNNHYPIQSDLTRHSYSPPRATSAFKLDEGFSEDIRSQDEGGQVGLSAPAPRFEEWVMAQSEEARAGKFHEVLGGFLACVLCIAVPLTTPDC